MLEFDAYICWLKKTLCTIFFGTHSIIGFDILVVMITMVVLMKSFKKDKQGLVSVYDFACSAKAKKLAEA